MTLTLLRHPRALVTAHTCYGRLDLPADPAHEQCVFEHVIAELPPQPVLSSPLQRCRRLAERVAAHWGVACRVDARLLELDFGRWEGLHWDAVPRAGIDRWAADPLGFAPGGGESLAQLHDRLAPWWAEALAHVHTTGTPLLAVTHGGPMRVLAALADGRPLADAARAATPACGTRWQHTHAGTGKPLLR